MIFINKPINLKKIKYILCDFDRTISLSNSPTSWSIFSLSGVVPMGFKAETNRLFNKYRPIELNHGLSVGERKEQMALWPQEQVLLFPEYGIDYKTYMHICMNDNKIVLRNDFPLFVRAMYEEGIPIHIISGGLYEPIRCKLEEADALLPNVHINANVVSQSNGIITGLTGKVITSMNKDEVINESSDDQGILFGDLPSDKLMARNLDTINVGFLYDDKDLKVYNREFDITLTGKSSFTSVSKILIKK